MASRQISITGTGSLIIGQSRFDGVQYQISGEKRSRIQGTDRAGSVINERVLSAQLKGMILNPQVVDSSSQMRTQDIECRLIRSDGRHVAIDFHNFPGFEVMRAADNDDWSDAVLAQLEKK
jgi:hypothetical protein